MTQGHQQHKVKIERKVKILATLGPSSQEETVIEQLLLAGVDVFRINMSHASHEMMRILVRRIRQIEEKIKRPIGILVDLQGPKLRIGSFAEGEVQLVEGQSFLLDSHNIPGDNQRVYLPHPEIFTSVKPGERLLIDDGRLTLTVSQCGLDWMKCEVVSGYVLSNRKGVSLPDSILDVGALTVKDREDLAAILEEDIDWIALSFIQRPSDIIEVRQIVKNRAGILSKIEKPQAIEHLEEIIALSDAVMVARGDLGVEMPLETVPGTQRRIINACRIAGKPVVVATQMLESMIYAPIPTRAEVSDVATAVLEGADAVMLSAESASGKYPIQAVQMMDRIACKVEREIHYPVMIRSQNFNPEATAADAISLAARQIAQTLNLAAIVAYTGTGTTGIRVARERPVTPIIALSPIIETVRRLTLVWGVHSVLTDDASDMDDMVRRACLIACKENFAQIGDQIIITAGVPFGHPGTTNMLKIAAIQSDA